VSSVSAPDSEEAVTVIRDPISSARGEISASTWSTAGWSHGRKTTRPGRLDSTTTGGVSSGEGCNQRSCSRASASNITQPGAAYVHFRTTAWCRSGSSSDIDGVWMAPNRWSKTESPLGASWG
jgi:hypothetical protein